MLIASVTLCISCKERLTENKEELVAVNETKKTATPKKALSKNFKAYWYAGNAEITSYKLEQARYGELRQGKAVKIFPDPMILILSFKPY